jgi:hypothetical protein
VLDAAPPLLIQLGALLVKLLAWVADRVPPIAAQLGKWALEFIGWVAPMIPELITKLGELLGAFLGWIIEKAPDILAKLGEWTSQFTTWVTTAALPALLTALGTMFSGLWTSLKEKWGEAWAEGSLGSVLVENIRKGVSDGWSGFVTWFQAQLLKLPGGKFVVDWMNGNQGQAPPAPPQPTPSPPGGAQAPNAPGTGGDPKRDPVNGRAGGGLVRGGQTYLVGERGPELFQAPTDGAVAPNSVYRAVVSPMAAQQAAMGSAPNVPVYPADSAGYGRQAVGPVSVQVVINNPVIDSAERQTQLQDQIVARLEDSLVSLFRRVILAEGR